MTTESGKMNRVEWGVVLALVTSAGTALFNIGYVYADVKSQGARVTTLERKVDEQSLIVTRIDANVTFLAERAREDRAASDTFMSAICIAATVIFWL